MSSILLVNDRHAKNIIKTLTLAQLLLRPFWQGLSIENIYEIARKGWFGLYFKPYKILGRNQRKSYSNLGTIMKNLMSREIFDGEQIKEYMNFVENFIRFIRNNKRLVKHYPGYVRLATDEECAIIRSCESGSVKAMSIGDGIFRDDSACAFGFEFMRPFLLSKKKMLHQYYNLGGKKITSDDLFVVLDDIEAYEKIISSTQCTEVGNHFIRRGDFYEIIYNGQRFFPVKVTKGLQVLEVLLKKPHKELSVNEIWQILNPTVSSQDILDNDQDGFQISDDTAISYELLDEKSIKTINAELNNLKQELTEAKKNGNFEVQGDIIDKIEKIEVYKRNNTFKNKSKTFITDTEKRRQVIKKAIVNGFKIIDKYSHALQEHLKKNISTGTNCSYRPVNTIQWQ
jgi:hypothetical protein